MELRACVAGYTATLTENRARLRDRALCVWIPQHLGPTSSSRLEPPIDDDLDAIIGNERELKQRKP